MCAFHCWVNILSVANVTTAQYPQATKGAQCCGDA